MSRPKRRKAYKDPGPFNPKRMIPADQIAEDTKAILSRNASHDYQIYDAMLFLQECKAFTPRQRHALIQFIEILMGNENRERKVPPFMGAKNDRFDEVDKEIRTQAERQGIKYKRRKGYVVKPRKEFKPLKYDTIKFKYRPKKVATKTTTPDPEETL